MTICLEYYSVCHLFIKTFHLIKTPYSVHIYIYIKRNTTIYKKFILLENIFFDNIHDQKLVSSFA